MLQYCDETDVRATSGGKSRHDKVALYLQYLLYFQRSLRKYILIYSLYQESHMFIKKGTVKSRVSTVHGQVCNTVTCCLKNETYSLLNSHM